ncbi:cytochrome c [Hoeflea marina]|uniref:Cytochrome c n=2 Tax=Hoeflea marina TaxID=274592 RepID=A0A317PRG7_9HYPH|nr:cytochrome c [Hoeflea marina]
MFTVGAFVGGVLLLAPGPAHADGDPALGEKVFKKCSACHAVGEGAKNRVGPELNAVVGRAAATVEGYRYSKPIVAAGADGLVWSEDTLSQFLADPKGFLKGTKMAFAGLKKDDDIADVIAYLKTFGGPDKAADAAPAEPAAEPAETAAGTPAAPEMETGSAEAAAAHGVLHLGRPATADEVAAWDIDVRPDGLGLPAGQGTVAQGETIFAEQCASCHGDFGEGAGRWPVLAGGQDTLTRERPVKTIGSYWPYLSTVYDYVRRAMPFGNARSLSDDDVYALTAYVLYLNDIVTDEDFELSKDNFSQARLPNEDNFIEDDRKSEPGMADKTEPCMSNCMAEPAGVSMRAAVLDVTPDADNEDQGAGSVD